MTKYWLTYTTFKVGMPIRLEFENKEVLMSYLVMTINNLREDYIMNVSYGERSFMVDSKKCR